MVVEQRGSTRFAVGALAAVCALGLAACGQTSTSNSDGSSGDGIEGSVKSVAVTQIVEHPALDAARDGIKDALEEAGYVDGETLNWSWESAQGNPATATQIANQFVGNAPDAIVAIATPSAQAAVAASDSIPVIFSAVTDPVGAELVSSLESPGGLATGVTDLSPIGDHLDLILEILPETSSIGVIYNAGEDNSVSLMKLILAEAPARNLEIVEATATSSSEVSGAAQSLVGKVDVIYVPTDNTVASALESVISVGQDNQLPVFAGDTDSVGRGAIASLGFDYYDVGRQTGDLVVQVLEGADPASLPVQRVEQLNLVLNLDAAAVMGVDIPAEIVDRADDIVSDTAS
ncbi:MAG: ABC transporter substrate-binding protein [Cyanobacteria bacterium P01_E01_bin.34]